jgi:hypothetical protein
MEPKFEIFFDAKFKTESISFDDSIQSTSGSFIETNNNEANKCDNPNDFFFLRAKSKAMDNPFPEESELSLAPGVLDKLQSNNAPLISFKDINSITLSKFILE